MELHAEVAKGHLSKFGEELPGDSVEIAKTDGSTIVVLSDGLGSGVKANILSSLTAKIATTMLAGGCTIEEVIDTLAQTLPVCEVRKIAYSTFTILQIFKDGTAYLAEYDNPPAFIGRGASLRDVPRAERTVGNRVVREAFIHLQEGDWIILVSDGVLHAGIGGVWNLGWGWERVGEYLTRSASAAYEAREVVDDLIRTCQRLYAGRPGDDATVAAVLLRRPRSLTVLVGPPRDPAEDEAVVNELLLAPGKKAICGGTTANIVARVMGTQVGVDLSSMDAKVPPTGTLEGIDLVTEGVLTLTYTAENLKRGVRRAEVHWKRDGASRLTDLLLEADSVRIIVGRAINPAHQSPEMPVTLALKQKVVDEIAQYLRSLAKEVSVEYH